jgi:uroporphyrinogen decarboxylase
MKLCLETEIVWIRARLEEDGDLEEERTSWQFADDSCQLLSPQMYEEFVAPYHRRLVDRFSAGGVSGIHMCGRVAHLIPTIWRLFHPKQWDLGYPIDPLWAKEKVGEDCVLMGNVSPLLLAKGCVADVEAATRRCVDSLAPGGGYIVMDGNNIPGDAPVENVRAMVRIAHRYGRYAGEPAS